MCCWRYCYYSAILGQIGVKGQGHNHARYGCKKADAYASVECCLDEKYMETMLTNVECCIIPKRKLRFPGYRISRVIEWLSTRFFSTGQLSNGGRERNKIWHKGSLRDEDDAQTSNTRIVQRKRAIPAFASDLGDDQSRYLLNAQLWQLVHMARYCNPHLSA